MADVALDGAASALKRLALVHDAREHVSYFSELSKMSLERLEQQPAQQRAAAAGMQHQLAELCLKQTPTFVNAYGVAQAVPKTVASLNASISQLRDTLLPRVEAVAERFVATGREAVQQRDAQMQLDTVYDSSLRSFIDTPLLIHSCVDMGAYDDALEVGRHFNTLTWGTGPVAEAVADDVRAEFVRMRRELLKAIEEPKLQLPRARRLISLLDALDQLCGEASRADICATFLKARYGLADRALKGSSSIITSVLDMWKDTVLGGCTIALSEFNDADVPELVATFSDTTQAALEQYLAERLFSLVSREHSSGTLESTAQEIATLHTQLCYLSARFSDYGLCFDVGMHGEPHGLFERVALRLWQTGLQRMVQLSAKERYIGGEPGERKVDTDMHHAPRLHAFPALAACVNALVAALNALRQFAPLLIHTDTLQMLGVHLDIIATRINGAQRAAKQSDRALFERCGAVFATVLVPWAARALYQGIYQHADAMEAIRAEAPRFMAHVDKLAARGARDVH